jgi:hypothetical protein
MNGKCDGIRNWTDAVKEANKRIDGVGTFVYVILLLLPILYVCVLIL